jgi:hypothetical protein
MLGITTPYGFTMRHLRLPPRYVWGHAVAQLVEHCATNRKAAVSIPDGVIGISHYGPGVDSASNRNEHQDYFLGGKGDRCAGLTTLPPSCADCLEIWEPQPPGICFVLEHFPGGVEGTTKNWSEQSVSLPRFERITSWIQIKILTTWGNCRVR